ncbi:penicillin-binding protein [Bacillus sp. AFS001701]|uniref:serine hydrolase domain-containing protein n=1 Tax=Bacillaceae TaxID=186817 RepID=UPI000BF5D60A|nr:serine hydrolase domain-containing protein [Bacillus sp. AFS001701]PET36221.1 penicillin-binding protein [Bacillus sp. AFS001701]
MMKKFYLFLIPSFLTILIMSPFYRFFWNKNFSKVTVSDYSTLKNVDFSNDQNKNTKEIDRYLQQIHFNGVVLVKKNEENILNKGYGYRDIQNQLQNTPNTYYPVGSISKFFVSTLLMQLKEEGKISFNDPISKYIPEFPNGSKLTLFHLISHTSGIKREKELFNPISSTDLIKKIVKSNAHYIPLNKWDYNDTNYILLAYVIEKVTGTPYGEYIKTHIFDKANMSEIGQGNDFYKKGNHALGYLLIQTKNNPKQLRIPNFNYLLGCGDIYSTVSGIQKMDEALISNKLIMGKSFTQFTKPYQNHYAFGIYNKGKYLYNHGVVPGINCMNVFDPVSKTYVIVFSNSQKVKPNTFKIAMNLFKLVNKMS